MWWCDARHVARALACAAALTAPGCGFRPLDGAATRALHGAVALENARDRDDFAFRERLRRHLGRAAAGAEYTLSTELRITQEGLAITPDDATTRYDVTGTARYTLTRRRDGVVAAQGTARSATAYSTLASPYATRIAERDARRRVAADLADRVHMHLATADVDAATAAP